MTRHLSAVEDPGSLASIASSKPPLWARIVGSAIGLGVLTLASSLLALGILAVWRSILGT